MTTAPGPASWQDIVSANTARGLSRAYAVWSRTAIRRGNEPRFRQNAERAVYWRGQAAASTRASRAAR